MLSLMLMSYDLRWTGTGYSAPTLRWTGTVYCHCVTQRLCTVTVNPKVAAPFRQKETHLAVSTCITSCIQLVTLFFSLTLTLFSGNTASKSTNKPGNANYLLALKHIGLTKNSTYFTACRFQLKQELTPKIFLNLTAVKCQMG